MKLTFALVLTLAVPFAVSADGLATSVCVVERVQFDKLVKTAGSITNVATGDLRAAALKTGFLPKTPTGDLLFDFSNEGKHFKLLVREREGSILYTILDVTHDDDRSVLKLVVVGNIAKGREVGEDWVTNQPFVVVLRSGNFLKQ